MIPVSKALKIISRETRRSGNERVELEHALGRVLDEDIVSDSDLPPFNRSQMDGYAVRAADTQSPPSTLKLVGESAAGRGWHKILKPGEAVRIMTGAPVPNGADAVQKLEAAKEDVGTVMILEPTDAGRFIVPKGKEIRKGKVFLKKGKAVTSGNIAVPAAFGYAKIKVAKQPRVGIISTGTEIVEIGSKPKRDQIRNSNSLMLKSLCEGAGAIATIFPIVGDSLSDLKTQISGALSDVDLLITTGGVSVGKYDLTKLALTELGAEIFFDKVTLKPGKPTVFGRLKKALVFGLPGNPVSAAATFYLFVRKALLIMQGATASDLPSRSAIALGRMKAPKGRDAYLPARTSVDRECRIGLEPLEWHGSSDFVNFANADCLVIVPKGKTIEAGDEARVLMLP